MISNACLVLNDANIREVPITNEEYEKILSLQQELLSEAALDAPTQKILDKLCLFAENILPNSIGSLMLLNEEDKLMYVKAAPSVPQVGWDALNGLKPGPQSGSCGNAVHHGKAQYIINTFEDERGLEFLQTAKAFNLCSCWSMPVKNELGKTIGSFALSSFEHRSPSSFHQKLLEIGASIASIVLKNDANNVKLEKMLYVDSLTNLQNKTLLQKELETGRFCTLIFLDINNFNYVNTAYGFNIGDKILVKVAEILKSMFHKHLYRINADQFALKYYEEVDIQAITDSIQQYFNESLITISEVSLKISFTYGGVYSDQDLLKHVSLALKKAKEAGRNRLHIFNESLDSSQNRQEFIAMNNIIHHAFNSDNVVPYFQGIYDNTQKKITKYESLVRIITDTGEVLAPFKFLEIAKLSGLLPKITKTMIERTFAIMSTNKYDFSINITEDDLSNYYLVDYLNEKTKEYGIEPYRIVLEILEGVSSSGQKSNIAQLKELKHYGYKLAIDDFGAEYSNFERVLELDVDFLKIDARYIRNIDTDKKSYEIVKSIANFANTMYITVIAEFVHSQSVQHIVNDLGITYSQGYYFSEPTPMPETVPLNS